MGTVRRVYDHFGMELSEEAETASAQEAAKAERHRATPGHALRLEDHGLSRAQVHRSLREVFEAYDLEP